MKLDEQSLRRPEWRGDVAVTLDDGQEWWLPQPRLRFVLATDENGNDRLTRTVAAQGDYQDALEAFDEITVQPDDDDDAGIRYILAMLKLAQSVLRLNYDLTESQIKQLLSWSPNQTDLPVFRVLEVAQGQSPKTTADGGPDA